jgi:hypothetical protein
MSATYFARHLSASPLLLELPVDKPRSGERSNRDGSVAWSSPAPHLRRLASESGIQEQVYVFAAFQVRVKG